MSEMSHLFGDGAVMRLSASILLVLCAASAHGLQLRHRASRGLPCLNDCSNALGERGVCVHGVCVCNAGFRGPDCSISTLPDRPIFEAKPGFLNASDDEAMAPGQTCRASTCNDICTYGGMCLDAATCVCSLDRDDAALEKKAVDFARQAKEELDAAMAKPVRPLSAPEFLALSEVVGALGAVMAPGDPCVNWKQWLGITCSVDGHVVSIDLGRMRLRGTISPAVSRLPYLRYLALNNNALTGSIPPGLFSLPVLDTLLLHRNHLTGPIPAEIGSARQLRTLALYGNRLSEAIPREIGFLYKLRYLDLSFNQLTGRIPVTLGYLPDVEALYLNNNRLSGNVPESLRLMTSLKAMRLENNRELRGDLTPVSIDVVFQDPLMMRVFKGDPQQRLLINFT